MSESLTLIIEFCFHYHHSFSLVSNKIYNLIIVLLRLTSMMGVSGGDDDVVQIQKGKKPGDPLIITVNCPDKTGLACDICRFILDFGLRIVKGGISNYPSYLHVLFLFYFDKIR